jgi:hypothetical protein
MSCKQNEPEEVVYNYLFMGHIYDENPIIDKRITTERLNQFDQIWLGGDLTPDSSVDWKLKYLDSIFDLKSESTHWTLGNHDIVSGRENVLDYTGKNQFYASYFNGITLINFDSNYNDQGDCEDVNEQTNFIKMVCDTIQKSSHLILMGHHVPWGKIENIDAWSFANTSIENRVFQCDTFEYFDNIIYPELVKVQQKQIQVISLAGDLGQKQSSFEYITNDSVVFLGSGILSSNAYNNKFAKTNSNDSVLVFEHKPSKRILNWLFVDVGN